MNAVPNDVCRAAPQIDAPLGLYVHLPWCVRKCPYCDFNSHGAGGDRVPERQYVDALIRDLDYAVPAVADRGLISLFIGGGTPSLFQAASIGRLLDAARVRMNCLPGMEITLEANPGAVDCARFGGYRDAGVNRLSIGVQSFNDDMLRRLGRIHDAAAARRAIEAAAQAGIANVNVDLMYGLPGQSVEMALDDLRAGIASGVTHLSWYQLTIEPNTEFHARPPVLPDADAIWEMQCAGQTLLEAAGYHQYEISAYGRDDYHCRHNLNYWQFGDYLGLGAGAHGKLSNVHAGSVQRTRRHRLPGRYMALAGTPEAIVETRTLDRDDLVLEFMLNAARLREGFPLSLFRARTGLEPGALATALAAGAERGLVGQSGERIVPTARGRRYLNDLLELFVPDAA